MIITLTIEDNAPVMYILNEKQNSTLLEILEKIDTETASTDLQRTYVIELLHFLTKLYIYSEPIEIPSAS